MAPLRLGILVLAAGLSRRFEGGNKLLQPRHGKALVEHVFALANSLASFQKIVVTHRDQAQVLALLPEPDAWLDVHNQDSASGMASSLRLGLAAMSQCHGVLVMLGDMPDVAASTLSKISASLTTETYAIVPTYHGQWGNPVLLGAHAMVDCADLRGDQGAKKLLLSRQGQVTLIETDDPAILVDFDDQRDFKLV